MIQILHIDDQYDDHELFSTFIKRLDGELEISWCDSAFTALETLQTDRPDCIVSDLQMPEMDGIELLRQLKHKNFHIPFIFYTGQGSEKRAAEALRAGADDYFTKELGFAQFERVLNSIYRLVSSTQERNKRQQVEAALKSSEEKYNNLFEQAGDYILLIDPATMKIMDANTATLTRHGRTREELLGRSIFDFDTTIKPERVERLKQELYTGNTVVFEATHRTAGGEIFPVEASAKMVSFDGKPIILSIERDITDKKQAERDRKRYEQEREILLRVSREINSTLDLQTVLQIMSDGAVELLDIESSAIYFAEGEEVYLWTTTPALPHDFPDEFKRARLDDHPHLQQAIESQETVLIPDTLQAELSAEESQIISSRKLRSLIYLPFSNEGARKGVFILGTTNKARNFTEYEINLCRTISNQLATSLQNSLLHAELRKNNKELQNEVQLRKKRESELEDSRLQLTLALKMGNLGLWEYDFKKDLFVFNDEFYAMLETDVEEVGSYTMSSKAYVERFVHPEDHALKAEIAQLLCADGEARDQYTYDHRVLLKGGKTARMIVHFKTIKDQKGMNIRSLGINQLFPEE